jgi:RNA polymerase sigma-70 factor (ECF subfamily)
VEPNSDFLRPTCGAVVKEDAQLIDLALAGDTDAFGGLVRRYQDRLYNSIARVCGCGEEAEDVVQEALIQAFLKLGTFRGRSAFYTWLYRIAFNTAMSRARRRKPTVSLEHVRDMVGTEPIDPAGTPDMPMEQQERSEQVQAALDRLSTEHRVVLVLREMDEFSYDEISEMLQLPVGTVRSRLHRARLQMRDVMTQHFSEEDAINDEEK